MQDHYEQLDRPVSCAISWLSYGVRNGADRRLLACRLQASEVDPLLAVFRLPLCLCQVCVSAYCPRGLLMKITNCSIRRTLGNDPMSNKPEDVSFNCSDYAHFLTPAQMDLCERKDKDYLPCMALGIKRAIQWCQKVFKDNYWNCTNWVGDYVFGKIVHRFGELHRIE